ncbi:MAG TPA: MBL fold metallo-hydrolase [Caulobacteraceae bacterium]|jgi:phosphoribosyl 1,2-cyclic phosphate phosphodiesterase|nr:MBL fold metallo-hydrolase [Caulobacteraceae bacterium]
MSATLEFTILGCGSSGGVPRADGDWGACDPTDPRNRRTRCSLLVRRPSSEDAALSTTVLIDTSPDLQGQTSGAGVKRLDAVLFSHDHADQTHGIDDLRAFVIRMRRRVPCHMDAATQATLTRRFSYVFRGEGAYPAICEDHLIPDHGRAWSIEGPSGAIPIVTFDQDHGFGVRSVGYRLGPVAYSSDVVELPPAAFEALRGVKVWIVDALRYTPHPTHSHLERTLEWIEKVRPERAILTNMHIDLDFATLAAQLPAGVEPAMDGLRFTVDL